MDLPCKESTRIIPDATTLNQRTMIPLVEHYRAFFALFDWSVVPEPVIDPSGLN